MQNNVESRNLREQTSRVSLSIVQLLKYNSFFYEFVFQFTEEEINRTTPIYQPEVF